ncbi:hypothetical protein HK102_009420, partial [Quaeritorhiza haematococci]
MGDFHTGARVGVSAGGGGVPPPPPLDSFKVPGTVPSNRFTHIRSFFQFQQTETDHDNGLFSDVLLDALGKQYKLHRIILCASPYFRSLLQDASIKTTAAAAAQSDSKRTKTKSNKNNPSLVIQLPPTAENEITETGLNLCLTYLYGHTDDDVLLTSANALDALAAAWYLRLDDLCEAASSYVAEHVVGSRHNMVAIWTWATERIHQYGKHSRRIRDSCYHTLLQCCDDVDSWMDVLCELPSEVVEALVRDARLFVLDESQRFEVARKIFLARLNLWRQNTRTFLMMQEGPREVDSDAVTITSSIWDPKTYAHLKQHSPKNKSKTPAAKDDPDNSNSNISTNRSIIYGKIMEQNIAYMHMTPADLEANMRKMLIMDYYQVGSSSGGGGGTLQRKPNGPQYQFTLIPPVALQRAQWFQHALQQSVVHCPPEATGLNPWHPSSFERDQLGVTARTVLRQLPPYRFGRRFAADKVAKTLLSVAEKSAREAAGGGAGGGIGGGDHDPLGAGGTAGPGIAPTLTLKSGRAIASPPAFFAGSLWEIRIRGISNSSTPLHKKPGIP